MQEQIENFMWINIKLGIYDTHLGVLSEFIRIPDKRFFYCLLFQTFETNRLHGTFYAIMCPSCQAAKTARQAENTEKTPCFRTVYIYPRQVFLLSEPPMSAVYENCSHFNIPRSGPGKLLRNLLSARRQIPPHPAETIQAAPSVLPPP